MARKIVQAIKAFAKKRKAPKKPFMDDMAQAMIDQSGYVVLPE